METHEYKLESLLQLALFEDYAQPSKKEVDAYFASLPYKHFILNNDGKHEQILVNVVEEVILLRDEDMGDNEKRADDPRIQDVALKNCPRDGSEIVGVSKKIEEFIALFK